jgi:hypothetical protein
MKNKAITIGDLVTNTRWPWYGTCIVVEMKDDRVIVHHQEGDFAQRQGCSWDYLENWVRIINNPCKKVN